VFGFAGIIRETVTPIRALPARVLLYRLADHGDREAADPWGSPADDVALIGLWLSVLGGRNWACRLGLGVPASKGVRALCRSCRP